jgi:hypothetical protein
MTKWGGTVRDADTGYVWFLECLDALHRAIQSSSDIGEALNAALAVHPHYRQAPSVAHQQGDRVRSARRSDD